MPRECTRTDTLLKPICFVSSRHSFSRLAPLHISASDQRHLCTDVALAANTRFTRLATTLGQCDGVAASNVRLGVAAFRQLGPELHLLVRANFGWSMLRKTVGDSGQERAGMTIDPTYLEHKMRLESEVGILTDLSDCVTTRVSASWCMNMRIGHRRRAR